LDKRIRNATNKLQATAHGDKKCSVEAPFSKFVKMNDIFGALTDGRSRKSLEFGYIENASSLGSP
jgi:hypothetical protein